jgi:protein-S-isoprenylcysteine O-methyltransferase Ste14
MAVLFRALVYATVFVSFVLVFLPARVLEWSGVTAVPGLGPAQVAGMVAVGFGALLALWCVLTFALVGRGTPAPFDPPRGLVVKGPYRYVRNPMYLGAAVALAGATLFYRSLAMLAYVSMFILVTHGFVRMYEERTLRRRFGLEYEEYCARVHRWQPRRHG